MHLLSVQKTLSNCQYRLFINHNIDAGQSIYYSLLGGQGRKEGRGERLKEEVGMEGRRRRDGLGVKEEVGLEGRNTFKQVGLWRGNIFQQKQ